MTDEAIRISAAVWEDTSRGVPPNIAQSVRAYVEQRRPVGGFLQHVIANDLMGAAGHADVINYAALGAIARLVFNVVPGVARGSREAYLAWTGERTS